MMISPEKLVVGEGKGRGYWVSADMMISADDDIT
jgi:hypothetical protein